MIPMQACYVFCHNRDFAMRLPVVGLLGGNREFFFPCRRVLQKSQYEAASSMPERVLLPMVLDLWIWLIEVSEGGLIVPIG